MRIPVFAVLAHDRGVVELIRLQKGLRIAIGVDVDFGDAIVKERILVAFCHPGLQPRQENSQAVALLDLGDEGLDGAGGPHVLEEALDEVFGAVQVDQGPDDDRALVGVDLHHVDFDILHQRVLVEVLGQLTNKTMEVANVDERSRIRQLGILQEVLNLLRIVRGAFPTDSFNLLHVPTPRCRLDVLEVDIRVSAGSEDCSQEVEDTLIGAELLEHRHDLACANLLVVLDRDLHHHLEVLAVVPQQVGQTLQGRLWGHLGEVLDQELRRHHVCLLHDALHVGGVRVVLEGVLHQTSFLAETSDVRLVVVCEHVHL
mmetsp:Transcript_17866/g.38285  ORF Transcript_17866/g.38285 Transcript_17866/m.38285 type:complete len:315 (+) Transcript_17866:2557-3501(+)